MLMRAEILAIAKDVDGLDTLCNNMRRFASNQVLQKVVPNLTDEFTHFWIKVIAVKTKLALVILQAKLGEPISKPYGYEDAVSKYSWLFPCPKADARGAVLLEHGENYYDCADVCFANLLFSILSELSVLPANKDEQTESFKRCGVFPPHRQRLKRGGFCFFCFQYIIRLDNYTAISLLTTIRLRCYLILF